MSPKMEKFFEKSYAIDLLKIAEGDFDSAEILVAGLKGRKENIFFLAHQCIEKSLKAVLCWHGKSLPLVHDLPLLISRVSEIVDCPYDYRLGELDSFATVRRYTEGKIVLSKAELLEVVTLANDVLKWCKQHVV